MANALNWQKDTTQIFFCSDGYTHTVPVRQFEANAFGLHDMLGNVSEWGEDCWNENYQGAPADGSAWATGDCTHRLTRGGTWNFNPWILRVGDRSRADAGDRGDDVGFRVARTL